MRVGIPGEQVAAVLWVIWIPTYTERVTEAAAVLCILGPHQVVAEAMEILAGYLSVGVLLTAQVYLVVVLGLMRLTCWVMRTYDPM